MNKDYLEYQYSKSKKLTERAFKLRIGMLMVSILACAGIMASSAFALFTCEINRTTTLTAAEFEIVSSYTRDARTIGEKIVTINATPGVIGYCKITVIDPDEVQHWYYTNAFCGTMNLRITAAAECQVIVDTPRWGYPQLNGIAPELIIGDGGTINVPIPEPKETTSDETTASSGDGEGSGGMLTTARPSSQTPVSEDTPTTEDTTESTPGTEQETVTEEKTVETTEKAEKSEITATPSVSEEKSSVENNNSTVSEAPVVSTPPSDNSSDSGASNSSGANTTASDNGNSSVTSSSGNSSDSGSSSGSVSSGTEASIGGTTAPASDDGGE